MDSTLDLELAVLRAKAAEQQPREKFDPNQPRDSHGRWAEVPGIGSAHPDLFGGHAGTPEDPVPCGADIERAAHVIGHGGNVTLDQPDEVATLLNVLRGMVKDAEAKGEKAPTYDLCKVSVPGTNLFCQDSLGIERIQMPQLSTKDPVPGSVADSKPRNKKGEVNLSEDFGKALADAGYATTRKTVLASHLRASQNELDGGKVAGIAGAVAAGKIDVTDPSGAIYVTRDNYVIDGHHRWAAYVGEGIRTGTDIDMPIIEVDTDIGTALTFANFWTEQMGIPAADVTKKGMDGWLARTLVRVPEMADVIAKFAEDQPRDAEGQWTDTGGSGRGDYLAGQIAGDATAPTDNVTWTRFDDAGTRLSDARKFEGQHVLAIMRKGPSHTGTLHVTDSALVVDDNELDPLEVRGLVGYANWEGKAFDPAKHPRDAEGQFTDVPGGGNPLAEPANAGPSGEVQAKDADDAWNQLDADRFDRDEQERQHPENYEPNRGYGTHLKLDATEWRRDVSEDGVPTIYQVRAVDSRTVPIEDWDKAVLPMTAPDGTPVIAVRVDGSERPDPFVYRVMSVAEFSQAATRGYFQSDQSMNLADEGTVTSRGSTGTFYAPPDGQDMRIVQLDMDPADGWKVGSDGYVKTHKQIPFERTHAYSTPLTNPRAMKRFDPNQPRDPHTGEWIDTGGGGGDSRSFETPYDAWDYFEGVVGDWANDPDVKDAMGAWSDTHGYKWMNLYMRKGQEGVDKKIEQQVRSYENQYGSLTEHDIENYRSFVEGEARGYVEKVPALERAIKSAPPLPEDVTVYRGLNASLVKKLEVGSTMTDKGFSATSGSAQTAGMWKPSAPQAMLEITVPAGTPAAWNSVQAEDELVLGPGTFTVIGRDGSTYLRMEYRP